MITKKKMTGWWADIEEYDGFTKLAMFRKVCCSVLLCVAVCCCVLLCVAVLGSVFQCFETQSRHVLQDVLQYVVVCCSVLQCASAM